MRRAGHTRMHREALEAAAVVAGQSESADRIEAIARALRDAPPRFVVTCARGSSDHAATFAKYLTEAELGIPVASAAPSIASVYGRRQLLDSALAIVISQSGRSPDIVRYAEDARAGGARLVALVNVAGSPLAEVAHDVLPIGAGEERSVAATKSYIGSLALLVRLVAAWSGDGALSAALDDLPAILARAARLDWSPAVEALRDASQMFVVGRGLGFGIAQEAALKLKETCGLHAEAVSAAEIRHGPMAIAGEGFPVLLLAQDDAAAEGTAALAAELRERGARVLLAAPDGLAPDLPIAAGAHPACTAIGLIQSFYPMAAALSVARDFDPDAPPYLRKVTETL